MADSADISIPNSATISIMPSGATPSTSLSATKLGTLSSVKISERFFPVRRKVSTACQWTKTCKQRYYTLLKTFSNSCT